MSDDNIKDLMEEKDLSTMDNKDYFKLMDGKGIPEDSEVFKEGFRSLLDGYVEYAQEVLVNRAVPDLRDGLKPVQRFGLWVLKKEMKGNAFIKSSTVASAVTDYHPHNDSSAYESLARMTDSNETFEIPMLEGGGSLGRNFSNKPPSASRYTKLKLHKYAEEMFTSPDGVKIIPNFDDTKTHAEVLPVSFPYVLCKRADGIAVGFSTNLPSFNINDVCDLVEEYVKNGECSTKIVPDFSTKGYIAPTGKELDRLMKTGKGRFAVRGKVEIDGKRIYIRELPPGTTVEKLLNEIEEKVEIPGISGAYNLNDLEHGCNIQVVCRSKSRVNEVLLDLYNKTSLQSNFNANMLTIEDKKLVITGVWGIIERWVAWRKQVLTKQLKSDLEKVAEELKVLDAFVKLLSMEGAKEQVIDLATHNSDEEAIAKVIELTECDRSSAEWVISRRLTQFRSGDKYFNKHAQLKQTQKELENELSDLGSVIVNDMRRIKSTIGPNFPRRTEITNTVYKENKDNGLTSEAVYSCYYEIKDGFIKKTSYAPPEGENSQRIRGFSDSILIALSTEGEIYRVYGDDLELSNSVDMGTYIPTYAGIKGNVDTQIVWGTIVDSRKYVLTYSDGFVGFLDTSEFLDGTIKSRYLRNGISPQAELLIDIREYKPSSALLAENYDERLVLTYLDSIKQKSRTARTRVWHGCDLIDTAVIPLVELGKRIPGYDKLLKKKPVFFNGLIDLESDAYVNEDGSVELLPDGQLETEQA